MGLIRAAFDSARTTLADQWIEYYYCDSLSNEVLIQKGTKVVTSGSNTKGSENIITNGSGFAVNEGQALLIVEDGKIVEFSTEPGRFTWDDSTEPSLFDNGWKGLKDSFKIFGKRFTMGGTPGKDQRVYFVNLKEIIDNKFGSATPMPYHDPVYRNIYIRYFGQYTFRIQDPIRFYANLSGNVSDSYTKTQLMQQCDAEFVNALDTALAKCGDEGYQFSDLPKRQMEIAADAEAEQMRRRAAGEADAIYAKMEAEARGIREKLSKQAEGMQNLVTAAGGIADDAVRLIIADKLEQIVAEQVEAIKNVKIDKVTVWDGGEGKDGKTATAGFLSGLLKSLPPLEEMYNMAGLSLPKIVSPQKEQTVAEKEDKPEPKPDKKA